MANRIVVDPITRIEGHLRAEVEVLYKKVCLEKAKHRVIMNQSEVLG